MKVVRFISTIALISLTMSCFAQRYFYAAWNPTAPLSNRSWARDGGAAGFRVGYRSFITDKLSAGIDLGTSSYNSYMPYQTREGPSGAITTDWFNYVYSYSGVISGQYNFEVGNKDIFFPYVGIGLGANHNEYVQYYNTYSDQDAAWGFLVRPETGILIKFGSRRSMGVMGALHFDYSTNKSELYNYNSFASAGFQLGIMFLEL